MRLIDRITYEADQIQPNQNQQIDIQIRGYNDNVIQETKTIEVREDGEYSVSSGDLTAGNYESYDFVVNLETTTSNSPRLYELVITGETYDENDLISQGFQWLLIFVGLMVGVRGVYN